MTKKNQQSSVVWVLHPAVKYLDNAWKSIFEEKYLESGGINEAKEEKTPCRVA